MSGIQIKGLKEAIAKLDRFQQSTVKRAAADAINSTVTEVYGATKREIADVFDRPTPYIQKAALYERATAGHLTGKVYLNSKERGKGGLSQAEVLRPHISGGQRAVKASERRLRRLGLLGPGQWIVPGPDIPKDQYGNVSGPTMVKILSQIQAFSEAGFNANAKLRGMTWKRYKQLGSLYVVPRVGVFSRQGDRSMAMLFFTDSAPDYEAGRFDFYFTAKTTAKRTFPGAFQKAVRDQMKS